MESTDDDKMTYVDTHVFMRDVYKDRRYNKFSPENFLKAFENYVDSEKSGALDKLNKKTFLFGKTQRENLLTTLENLNEDLKMDNEQGVKQHLTDFLHQISKNQINGKIVMESYAALGGVLGLELDYSNLRKKDFYNKDENKSYYAGVVGASFNGLGEENSQLDMQTARKAMDGILRTKRAEKEGPSETFKNILNNRPN